jgi:hypothetical protein
MWALNPRAHKELAPFGKAIGIPFLLLTVTLAVAGMGWLKRRLWEWWLAVAIIATQVLGDLVNVFLGRVVEGSMGVAIAGALLFYVLRPGVRAVFASGDALTFVEELQLSESRMIPACDSVEQNVTIPSTVLPTSAQGRLFKPFRIESQWPFGGS